MPVVEYSSNNSGGSWWLDDADWKALEAAGWDVDWVADKEPSALMTPGARWLGALATSASKEFDNPEDAIEEFEAVTGEDASAQGCNCCGAPHSFSYTDDAGNYHYASSYVVETDIRFD